MESANENKDNVSFREKLAKKLGLTGNETLGKLFDGESIILDPSKMINEKRDMINMLQFIDELSSVWNKLSPETKNELSKLISGNNK